MNLHHKLVVVATAYANLTGNSLTTVARNMAGNRYLFQRIAAGNSLTCANWERCMQWLSDNWPDRKAWPKGITRPEKTQ